MNQYVALLRGIGPGNPNMRNEHLRRVAESVGLAKVSTVISSGNIVFSSASSNTSELESTLETAWPEQLGFESTTIVRSRENLEQLVKHKPFGSREHNRATYLLVTFFKHRLPETPDLPDRPTDQEFLVVGATNRELFTVANTTAARTPDVMSWVEKTYGKAVSSRTWLTVERILDRMERQPR